MCDSATQPYERQTDASSNALGTLTSVVGAALTGDADNNRMADMYG